MPTDGLSILLPPPADTDLVRACLWSGAAARAAWARWQRAVGDARRAFKNESRDLRLLLPLLDDAVQRNGIAVDSSLRSALGAAGLTETVRSAAYHRVCALVFDALAAASIPFLVLKGCALADTVYPKPALRHSHDIDLLVSSLDLGGAAEALGRAGFAPAQGRRRLDAEPVRLIHASGLPIELHCRLFRLTYYAPLLTDVWARARQCDVAGRTGATLSVAEHVVHVCGQASCCRSRDSLKWVCDTWYLVAQHPDLDWEVVQHTAHASRLALPLAVLLKYLAVQLEVPVPAAVLDALSAAAATADRVSREIAWCGVRASRRGTFRNLFRATPRWSERAALLKWMLLPSPTSLRYGEPLRHPRVWPAYYAVRPLRYIARRLWRRGYPATMDE
jgi:hypothetical protein